MVWTIEIAAPAAKELKKLDKQTARQILDYLKERVSTVDNPRATGKALQGPLGGLWRYRVGDYRIMCEIHDTRLRVLVLRVGHRSSVYD